MTDLEGRRDGKETTVVDQILLYAIQCKSFIHSFIQMNNVAIMPKTEMPASLKSKMGERTMLSVEVHDSSIYEDEKEDRIGCFAHQTDRCCEDEILVLRVQSIAIVQSRVHAF